MESLGKNRLLPLPPNIHQILRKMHNLDKPERLKEAIDILQDWIEKQDHILKKDFGRDYFEKTLIASKGSVEKAKKQIDRLCTMKTLLPQFFTKTNVKEELNCIADIAWLVPLPQITSDYYRILVIKINNKLITEDLFMKYFQFNMILCEYIKAHDYVNGFIIVYDFQEANIVDVVTKLNPVVLQQYMSILVEGFGARLKGIEILTQSKAVDLFVKMMKQFLSQKLSSRVHVHRTMEELYKVVPKDALPIEYGGNDRPIKELVADWIEELSSEEHVKYVTMMHKACTDEKLRRSDQFNEEYNMGMPGSFRNITVD